MFQTIEGRKRRGRQDDMVGWHHRLNEHEFEQGPGDGKEQGTHAVVHGVTKSRTGLSD